MIAGGLGVWSLLLVACTTVPSMMVVPHSVPGAQFVGSSQCADCHSDIVHGFADATHAKLSMPGGHDQEIGCESCHGAGSLHVRSGGERHLIVNPKSDPSTCYQCHLDKQGQFNLAHSHPIGEGKMSCSDCHDPHTGSARPHSMMTLADQNASCTTCHTAQRGPFVFEHEASREGCTTCHEPHGTVNRKMLKAANNSLCTQCHFQQQTAPGVILIGGYNHSAFLTRGTCWTAGCHEAVHGSHVNSSLRY
jgi:predicted CXXCH cytochrome family protein